MLWISLVIVLQVVGGNSLPDQNGTRSQVLYNDLNIRYDHCRAPQVLNRVTWQCECPAPLRMSGDDCICDNCLVNSGSESYAEGMSHEPPEFLSGFLKKMAEDDKEMSKVSNRMFWNGKTANRRTKNGRMSEVRRMIRHYAKRIMNVLDKIESCCATTSRRSGPPRIILRKDPSLSKFLRGLRLGKRRPDSRVRKIDWDRAKIVHLRRPEGGDTFSDTVIGEQIMGSAASGDERAFGKVVSTFGTGSMSLGAGGGSAGAAAFTGEGSSALSVESNGGKAFGMGMIGKKAVRGTSTTTMLVGEGDAIGTNARTKTASASATAVATKEVATAGATAFGAASAAASAAPGDGSVHGAGSYDGDGVNAKAGVEGDTIAEASASGNPDDDLREYLRRQHIFGTGVRRNFAERRNLWISH